MMVIDRDRPPIRFLLIILLAFLSAIAFLDRTNISIAGEQINREFSLGHLHLGWVFSAFLIGYALFQIPAGWLAGRLGPRKILALGVLWWGVFTGLTACASPRFGHVLLLLLLIRFALGMGEAMVYPASNQFVAAWIPLSERGKANGFIFAGVGAGAGLTPPLLTSIILHYGWRASFWFSAVAGLVAGVIWYLASRDLPEQHPLMGISELAYIRQGIMKSVSEVQAKPAIPWGKIFSHSGVWAVTLSYFTFGYVAWIFFSWFYIYLAQVRKLDLKTSALYTMLPFLAMTLACIFGGIAVDIMTRRLGLRWGRCGLAAFALMLTALFLVVGSSAQDARLASLILAGGAGALYLSQSSYWSVTADIAGPHSGLVSGIMNMGCQIGGALTASLTPFIAQHAGWNMSFFVAAVLAFAGGILWLLVDPNQSIVHADGKTDVLIPASRES